MKIIKILTITFMLFLFLYANGEDTSGWVVSIDPIPPSDYGCFGDGLNPCVSKPPKKQHDLNRFCSRGGVGETDKHWKVAKDLRNKVDKKLKKIFVSQNDPLNSSELNGFSDLKSNSNLNTHLSFKGFSDFKLYARQYLGFHSDGEKKIYINAYRINDDIKITENNKFLWWTCHGGKNFWGIVYNIKHQAFESLSFNNFGPPVRAKKTKPNK